MSLWEFNEYLYGYFTADPQDGTGCAHNQLVGFEQLLEKKPMFGSWGSYIGEERDFTFVLFWELFLQILSIFPFPAHSVGKWV